MTVVACNNTKPAIEANNHQLLPFSNWSVSLSGNGGPTLPVAQPLRSIVVITDPTQVAFTTATLSSVGSGAQRALVFSFGVNRPALVRYSLVRNVVDVLATGMFPVFDTSYTYNVSISRDCSGVQLVPGTAYGLWYNATDIYGAGSALRMLSAALV